MTRRGGLLTLHGVKRSFNTAGPCVPERDYMLPATRRLERVPQLIESAKYFIIHAPRQVGKTTAFLALAEELTAGGRYLAVLLSVETGAPFPDDVRAAQRSILRDWRDTARARLAPEHQPPPWDDDLELGEALSAWSRAAALPLVVFIDEIDALSGVTLSSVLRQLRARYALRPTHFPHSLALIGMRDLREYRLGEGVRVGTASPFNIIAESLVVRSFDVGEVRDLLAQHTAETGQAFSSSAADRIFDLTRGQPWLVNALARQLTEVIEPDRARTITELQVEVAKEVLIQRQDTHVDSLAARLREPRVRAVVEPMLAGGTLGDLPEDDRQLAVDLGLLRRTESGGLDVANPIYREVIVRALASGPRDSLPAIKPTWLDPSGRLEAGKLLDAFLAFWRQHGEPLLGTAPYHEVAPHLVLMAFLHRVVNGSGTVEREYAIGRGRMDLLVRLGEVRVALELKVWRDGRPDPVAEGLAQLEEYLQGLGLDSGWLVVFDRRTEALPVAVRTGTESGVTPSGRRVVVVRA